MKRRKLFRNTLIAFALSCAIFTLYQAGVYNQWPFPTYDLYLAPIYIIGFLTILVSLILLVVGGIEVLTSIWEQE